ncbi:MAG: hypothetical protein CL610_29045 [Anaerolineaceae bacterium]|nr:hypothetical protein [Anaerolineaceae bacterium]
MVTHSRIDMDEFVELVENNPEKHFDFTADGEIIEVSPKLIHGLIQAEIARAIGNYLHQNHIPEIRVATEVAHDLNGWPCRPDVSLNRITDAQIPTTAPLLAVEIKSDSNSLKDLRAKARKYIEHGTRMVWLIFPDKRLVEVYEAGADDLILTEKDTLNGGAALPHFTLPVQDIFVA